MPTIHVKRGIEFRTDLFANTDKTAWLDAVGKELETKGVSIKVGEGATAKEVKNGAELKAAYAELQVAANTAGRPMKEYVNDLLEALDDVVKSTSSVAAGDKLDFSKGSDLAKALGIDNPKWYGSTSTEFGKATRSRPDGTFNVAGAMLSKKEVAPQPPTPPVTPPTPPVTPGVLDRSLIDNPDGTPKINYISKATFANQTAQVGRDGIEVEWVGEIQGVSKDDMHKILTQGNTLRRLQRPSTALAYTLGSIPLDEMKWDADSHRMREANPYLSVTIESSRGLRRSPESGQWELQVSRDTFVDRVAVHVDVQTNQPTRLLREQGMAIRVRERIEGADGRSNRTLIQSKLDSTLDPTTGLKMPLKRDIRTDSPNDETHNNLDKSLETGQAIGFWNSSGVDAIASMHAGLAAKGVLPDIGPHEDVLVMRPLAYKKQARGRFHYNETPTPKIREVFQQAGEAKIKALVDSAAANTNLSAAEKSELAALGAALLDRSAIVKAAEAGLKALDPNMTVDKAAIDNLWPDRPFARDTLDANKRAVVAEAIKGQWDVFAERIDALGPKMAGTVDASGQEIRSLRDAPSPGDLRDYLRTKVSIERFMTFAEREPAFGVVAGQPDTYVKAVDKMKTTLEFMAYALDEGDDVRRDQPATFVAFLNKIKADLAGPNGAALLERLRDADINPELLDEKLIGGQAMGARLESAQIFTDMFDEDVTPKMFEAKLGLENLVTTSVNGRNETVNLASAETAGPLLSALDKLLAGANKDAFIADFAGYLAADGQDRLSNAPDKAAMLGDTKKRLMAQDFEITHRMIESAGTQAKTLAFDAQRSAYCGVTRNDWGNFLINSADTCEYLNAEEGKKLAEDYPARGSARPLDPSRTLDLRFSMDVQIELEYADPYFAAIEKAQRAIAQPLFMEFALAQANSGVNVADKKTFTAFIQKNLPFELPAPNAPDRPQQMAAREAFVKQVADFVAQRAPDVKVDERMLLALVYDNRGRTVESFNAVNPGITAADLPKLTDNLKGAVTVWSRMTEAQTMIGKSAGDGFIDTIRRAARDANVTLGNNVTWGTPAASKDDYAVDLVVAP